MQEIRQFEGEVYCSDHPWYLAMAGKPTQGHDIGYHDTIRARGTEKEQQHLREDYEVAFMNFRYEAVILGSRKYSPIYAYVPNFEDDYELVNAELTSKAFRPLTSWDRRPLYLYVRKSSSD